MICELRRNLRESIEPIDHDAVGGACRKPKGGLVRDAVELLSLELQGSYLVGDTARDILAAEGTPLRTVYVHSGKPPQAELDKLAARNVKPTAEAMDLAAAADWILRDQRGEP